MILNYLFFLCKKGGGRGEANENGKTKDNEQGKGERMPVKREMPA